MKLEIKSLHEAAAQKEEEIEEERRMHVQKLKERAEMDTRAQQLHAIEVQKDRESVERRHAAELSRLRSEFEEQMRQTAEANQVRERY